MIGDEANNVAALDAVFFGEGGLLIERVTGDADDRGLAIYELGVTGPVR